MANGCFIFIQHLFHHFSILVSSYRTLQNWNLQLGGLSCETQICRSGSENLDTGHVGCSQPVNPDSLSRSIDLSTDKGYSNPMDHSCIAPAKDQTEGSQDNSCMTVPPGSKHGRSKDQTASCGRLFERRQCCQPTRTILPEEPGRTGGDEESWNLLLLPHFSLCQITDLQGPSRTYTKNVQAHLKGQVCTKEVGLQPLWWFHSHLHPVLQHAHGEMRWRPKHKES